MHVCTSVGKPAAVFLASVITFVRSLLQPHKLDTRLAREPCFSHSFLASQHIFASLLSALSRYFLNT